MRKWNIVISVFFCMVLLGGCQRENSDIMTADTGEEMSTKLDTEQASTQSQEDVYVYVCGHVRQPGVYCLKAGSRICEAISLAGGILEDGRAEALNQAQPVADGQTLYVPGIDEEQEEGGSEDFEDGLVDINKAAKEELMTLPGIGESKALSIIQYREEHGLFESVEELMEIPGIKEGIFNKIKNSIKV